ncbi:hypothetical protein QL285_011093 [Trifolium repens]|nr:hypothetical protein QL285_011093 [Trifolium repens]
MSSLSICRITTSISSSWLHISTFASPESFSFHSVRVSSSLHLFICKEIVILCLDVPPMIFVFNAVSGGISSTLGSLLLERCLLVIVLGDKLEDLKSFDKVLNI